MYISPYTLNNFLGNKDIIAMTEQNEFSRSTGHRLIKSQTSKRVSKPVARLMGQELTDFGLEIADHAIDVAGARGRVTVRAEDIKTAARELRKER